MEERRGLWPSLGETREACGRSLASRAGLGLVRLRAGLPRLWRVDWHVDVDLAIRRVAVPAIGHQLRVRDDALDAPLLFRELRGERQEVLQPLRFAQVIINLLA